MEMMHYHEKQIDPKRNILYGSTKGEEFITFGFDRAKEYPIRVEAIGITNPDRDYYIQRKHGDYFVLEYVVSGRGYVENDQGEFDVEADCVYMLQPGMRHRYGADKKSPYKKIWINFFSSVFTDLFAAYGISDRVVFPHSGCGELFQELLDIARRSADNDDSYLDVSGVIFRIMLALAKNVAADKQENSVVATLVKQALDGAIYRKVTVEQLSEELSISKSQMTREFRKYYGAAPYQYLLDRKIAVAERLLITTAMQVNEISELLGFSDAYYFSDLFKRKMGKSPRAYRLGE